MKSLFLFAVGSILSLALPVTSASASSPAPKESEVVVGVVDAFIPSGFDSESEAYVVANGLFPNGCYRWKRAEVKHDWANKVHEIRSIAGVNEGMCIMVLVPFTQSITVGKLGTGEHKLRFVDGNGNYMEKALVIE
ncbi:MAG: hypothetical protein KDD35_05340 [Bdellovibrionales bacterium]|nr:hypothetical protein [Bdellovibrionales bacterium]